MPARHEPRVAEFRFYEELNDCLPAARRKRTSAYHFVGTPSVKDVLRAAVVGRVPLQVHRYFRKFARCRRCKRIYWHGAHSKRLTRLVKRVTAHSQ